jgi:hypothetical protein
MLAVDILSSIYALRSALGGTFAAVEVELGWDASYRKGVTNKPGGALRCSPSTHSRVNDAMAVHCPFPLKYMRRGREILTELKSRPGSKELARFIAFSEEVLTGRDPQDQPRLVEYEYMRMMTAMSKALHHHNQTSWFGGPAQWPVWLRDAKAHADKAINLIDSLIGEEASDDLPEEDRKRLHNLRAFVEINRIQIIQEQSKKGYLGSDGEPVTPLKAQKIFRDCDALESLKKIVEAYPWIWQAIYNGLEIAATLAEDDYALWFHDRLTAIDPGFHDFDYPHSGEIRPISAEPGMAYFNAKFRATRHQPINQPTKK